MNTRIRMSHLPVPGLNIGASTPTGNFHSLMPPFLYGYLVGSLDFNFLGKTGQSSQHQVSGPKLRHGKGGRYDREPCWRASKLGDNWVVLKWESNNQRTLFLGGGRGSDSPSWLGLVACWGFALLVLVEGEGSPNRKLLAGAQQGRRE